MEDILRDFLMGFAYDNPWITSLALLISTARSIFKPLMTLLTKIIIQTPWTFDDRIAIWLRQKIVFSWWYPIIAWTVDFFLSIKLPTRGRP